ncbi:MAG: AAA family ATPase [Gammaproteobacteria bacterium]|nr:AAA family ATPase [Gammaproteobacteria bacterium]
MLSTNARIVGRYSLIDILYSSPHFDMYRAKHVEDQSLVTLKMLRGEHPSPSEIAILHHEYHLLKQLKHPGIIQAEKFVEVDNRPNLILQHVPGESLKTYLGNKPLDLDTFFKISIPLVDLIMHLHQHQVVHKDIKPMVIYVDPDTLQLTLVDLSLAAQIDKEGYVTPSTRVEGTLAYISPEQTGRINRPVDYRTDFYSLGVTFFEMLTGRLPFPTDDPLELVHCHIAKKPPSVISENSDVPKMVSNIVAKLLAKIPKKRYISAGGLKSDLMKCAKEWKKSHTISEFTLGQDDVQDQLQVSQKLYGRENEIAQLMDLVKSVSEGKNEVVFISGYSGIGKTSLVAQVKKNIEICEGFFISGKFDQLLRSTPYSAVVEAFGGLIKQVLSEPEASLKHFKQAILDVLGSLGQLIVDVIPEVALIIGQPPPVPSLDPAETQSRFNFAFSNFVRVFARPQQPLVLFLDDLQWVDYASLKLIENLMTDPETSNILLIGAYRSNEVGTDHPLYFTEQKLLKNDISIQTIFLQPLAKEDVQQLLKDTFKTTASKIEELAELLIGKTQGNPFFINQFLKMLYREKLLAFSYKKKKWEWDVGQIKLVEATDNVVDFLVSRLAKLPPSLQKNLKLAACIGYVFDLHTLAKISKQSMVQTTQVLWEAIQEDLIYPKSEATLTSNESASTNVGELILYQFSHDRIQQSIYTQVPLEERQRIHLQIGRLILSQYQEGSDQEQLFEMIGHFSQCLNLINDPEEIENISHYSLRTGERAKESTAYQAAIVYLKCGATLLEKIGWEKKYDQLFHLYKELIECEYLISDPKMASEHYEMLINKTKNNLDKVSLYQIKFRLYTSQGKLAEAANEGLEALKLFNIRVPVYPSKLRILKEILATRLKIGFRNIETLDEQLGKVKDPYQKAVMENIFSIGAATALFNQLLFSVMVCKEIKKILEHGYTSDAPLAFGAYAAMIMRLNWHDQARQVTALASRILNKFPDIIAKSRYHLLVASQITSWYYPLSQAIEDADASYQYALEAGELIFATWATVTRLRMLHAMGTPLSVMIKETERVLEFISRFKYDEYGYIFKLYWQFFKSLTAAPEASEEKLFDNLDHIKVQENKIIRGNAYALMAGYFFFKEDYSRAIEMALEGKKFEDTCYYVIFRKDMMLYHALSIAECYETSTHKKEDLKLLKKMEKQFKHWVELCSENYLDKYLIISALIAQVKNKTQRAGDLFEQAIKAAHENGFIQNAAIACECAAKFYIKQNNLRLAKSYIIDAYYGYERWGALAKCKLLEKNFSQMLMTLNQAAVGSSGKASLSTTSTKSLDTLTILKSAQAISGEIILENLLIKLMQIVLENAGAERCYLIIERAGQWWIRAEGHIDERGVIIGAHPLHSFATIPHSLIDYVQRTHENIVLGDARLSLFARDPYIKEYRPKSVLCMSMKQKGLVKGLLYLENNATANAFTPERIEILTLLSSQAAISLDNAELYTMSERFVPHPFLDQLQKPSLIDVQLGDQTQQTLSILFCDIRGFTSISETLTPSEVFKLINEFLGCLEPVISKQGGFIDKYIGDAIMAIFNSADSAVSAAIGMIKALGTLNRKRKEKNLAPLKIGIGINTGELMLGIIGTTKRMDSSVIGDTVNIAARIEELTKHYKACILISEETRLNLIHPESFTLKLVGETEIRGKLKSVKLWLVEEGG